jgi:hypothetical protein
MKKNIQSTLSIFKKAVVLSSLKSKYKVLIQYDIDSKIIQVSILISQYKSHIL